MITFTKKAEARPASVVSEEKTSARTPEVAKKGQEQSDTDGTKRRARRPAEDDKLI